MHRLRHFHNAWLHERRRPDANRHMCSSRWWHLECKLSGNPIHKDNTNSYRDLSKCLHMDQEPRHFYLTVWGQTVWGWFLDQNSVLNLKIHFLQTAGGGFGGKSAFLGDFGTFVYVNLHNVSHYQISVRSWQIWYHIEALSRGSAFMCRYGGFSGYHGNGSHKLSKNRGKMGIFCNLCVNLVSITPSQYTQGLQYGY